MIPKECPINKPRKRTPKKSLEASVIRDCLALLHDYPDVIYVERRNTGAVKFTDGGFIRFGSPGGADIWCLLATPLYELIISADDNVEPVSKQSGSYLIKHIEIEAKRADGKGRQSPAQKRFQAMCDDWGIPYLLVTSAEELQKALDKLLAVC
ncbi:MAG: hypothetical protein KKH61_20955 [Gammaproteobacteria bacterium]|nr:hypothetical protein [Gammaproteobacteria bacterium]